MSKTLEILKEAILLERRGRQLYSSFAEQAGNEKVKKIFSIMANEEKAHEDFLTQQYKNYLKERKFTGDFSAQNDGADDRLSAMVFDKGFINTLGAASFEAAAISASIELENKTIKIYTERAKNAPDPFEKSLFQMLADWEKTHFRVLRELDDSLKSEVWDKTDFWDK